MLRILLLTAMAISSCLAYGSGAPKQACGALGPQHPNTTAQTTPCPFTITTSSSTYQTRGFVKVTLSGGSTSFGGFILQARSSDTNAALGHFNASSLPDVNRTQVNPCNASDGSFTTVTHMDPNPKNNLTFTWFAGEAASSSIYFQGAFAVNYSMYWIGIKSGNIALDTGSTTVTQSSTTSATETTTNKPTSTVTTTLMSTASTSRSSNSTTATSPSSTMSSSTTVNRSTTVSISPVTSTAITNTTASKSSTDSQSSTASQSSTTNASNSTISSSTAMPTNNTSMSQSSTGASSHGPSTSNAYFIHSWSCLLMLPVVSAVYL